MADRVLITADRNNIEDCIILAQEFGLGIEVMAFAYPDVLDGNWQHELATYRTILRPITGGITIHGPFLDMVSGSPDGRINQVCIERYQHAIYIASELGAELMVLHANFIGSLHNDFYRDGWHKRNVPFWKSIGEFAQSYGMTIAVENMWEFEPSIIGDLLRDVDHPNIKACLDVGHATLFSNAGYQLVDWLSELEPWLIHTHMNNNNGVLDEHHGFDWEHGVLDYHDILKDVRALKNRPNIVLEMWQVEDMRASLPYFELKTSEKPPVLD